MKSQATTRTESTPLPIDEDRLAHALVTRGLVTAEEIHAARTAPSAKVSLLGRLVDSGHLAPSQARRVQQELATPAAQQIPGYQLLEKLGQGSMGIVYKARQISMNRMVAIKVLHPRLAANPKYLERFTQEAHIAARLNHNNVVQAIDVGSIGNLNYFIMEYVQGTTIKADLEAGKIYGEQEALEIVRQIAQALDHAHRRHLVHRDIKPANIVLTTEGVAKLADLGLAREMADQDRAESEKGLVLGTPYYIAPEQIQGDDDIDVRADIYALGATLYHMVTGQPPYPGANVDKVLRAHLKEELTPPDHLNTKLSAGLGQMVEVMMAKDRDRRYQNPGTLLMDLESLLAGQPPKVAGQQYAQSALHDLAEGEIEDETDVSARHAGVHPLWLGVLGGILGLSLILNVILVLSRK
ncbi:MAG TPA: serine/threonine-protein kinase [Gemmataceae bacterium]|jgi:serine/threonine-protein kinase|nr:serine/threonine-protein kinase [Gemmataceae bacterium]